jgi:Macro domain.
MHVQIRDNLLELLVADITTLSTDAIVNAANGTLMGGGGVDGAIHRKAGPGLLEECKAIRREKLHGKLLPTGEVVVTKGYRLPARYVLHTVGPIWSLGNEEKINGFWPAAIETVCSSPKIWESVP